MSSRTTFIGLKLGHVPMINLRFEFRSSLRLFRNERFRKQFPGPHNGEIRSIETDFFSWHGMPNVLLTHILRDAIVGLESAVSGAVYCEALDRGSMNTQIMEATKDPFSLKAKGTAACVYDALPSLIDKKFALSVAQPDLWTSVKKFYKEVRNPIFHAYQIEESDPDPTWKCLELIWEIYQWLNSWHPLEKIAGSMISWSEQTLKDPSYIPALQDGHARQIFPERSLLSAEGDSQPGKRYPILKVKYIKGLYVGTIDRVDISMIDADGEPIVAIVPPFEAMRLLDFLSKAQSARGWRMPDEIDGGKNSPT